MLMFEKMNNNQVAQVAHVAMYLLLPNVFAVLHWLAVRVYSNYCSPPGFMGLVTSLFNTANPFCSYTLEIMEHTKNFYTQSWILIGVSSVGLLNLLFKNSTSSAAAVSSAAAATAGTGTTD
jgi:hypothetical protein